MLSKRDNMHAASLAAFHDELSKIAFYQKEAAFWNKPAVAKPLAMSFKGHTAALKPLTGTRVSQRGIETAKSWNPTSQAASVSKHIVIPGVTSP